MTVYIVAMMGQKGTEKPEYDSGAMEKEEKMT